MSEYCWLAWSLSLRFLLGDYFLLFPVSFTRSFAFSSVQLPVRSESNISWRLGLSSTGRYIASYVLMDQYNACNFD